MATFVVLLRGVNVGKAKRVPMADFKTLLVEQGCTSVTTLLNSGNAVVTAPQRSASALRSRVERAIDARFGFGVLVVVKTARDLQKIVAGHDEPVDEAMHSRLVVALANDPEALIALAPLAERVSPPERFVLGEHAAYLYCANGILESRAAAALLGPVGRSVTTRNWATLRKLAALAQNPR